MPDLTVIEIVKAHLIANGNDGLVMPDAECGCLLDDLVPCDGNFSNCRPGYRGVYADATSLEEWYMYATKEVALESVQAITSASAAIPGDAP